MAFDPFVSAAWQVLPVFYLTFSLMVTVTCPLCLYLIKNVKVVWDFDSATHPHGDALHSCLVSSKVKADHQNPF